jgi:C-terminal processing protease CtpA/Prc
VITLRSFATTTAVRQQLRRLADDYPEHARRPTLLIDLRGNQGGSLEYLRAWIAQARQGEWRSHPYQEVVGALWPCGPWNVAVERQIREGTVDLPEARAERERLRAAWSHPPPAPPSRLGLGLQRGRATHPYTGRVVVLLDRNAGSSGELAALDLRRALGAVLVGERSAGTMQYGEVRRFVLPHTGLVCQVPTRRFLFDTAVEGVGVPVAVYLERSEQDVTDLIPSVDRLWSAGHAGENHVSVG